MKKIILSILAVCIMAFSPIITSAKNTTSPPSHSSDFKGDTAGVYKLLSRMDEIKSIDKADLTFKEKMALRKELRDINRQLKAMDYIYLSAGTLLLIIILLIIFL